MSLINQNKNFSIRDYLFLAAGLLGIVGFFMTYASQEPRSIIEMKLDRQGATLKAAEISNSLGYNTGNFETETGFESDLQLLDSLQRHLGRQQAITRLSKEPEPNLHPYHWSVRFSRSSSGSEANISIGSGDSPERRAMQDGEFIIKLSADGKWIELENPNGLMPDRTINREALRAAFESDSALSIWSSLPDSAWFGILSFDMENGYNMAGSPGEDNLTAAGSKDGREHQFKRDDVLRLARFHVSKAGWDLSKMEVSDIRVETMESTVVSRLKYINTEPVLGQNVVLEAAVTPIGSLLELNASYNPSNGANNNIPPLWELTAFAAVFLFGIASIIIFYFRIRARVVDTKSALVISILAGLIVPGAIFLDRVNEINIFGDGESWMGYIILALSMGVSGAFASVGFFIVSAIGDSITRQHWPDKLYCYDYIRQGMVFNKPVGETLVRSVILTFIMAGLWSILLWFFPNLYFETGLTFLTYEAALAPLYLILDHFWFSLIVILGIFLVVGSQVYAQTNSKWIAGTSTMLATALIAPIPFSLGPPSQQFLLFLILGIALTLIFVKWDFLTLFLTHFIFTCLLVVSSGWVVENSPDTYVFISFIIFLLFISAGGTLSIVKGKEERALPGYVPEYVEELAQEERIKQELQIARDVQQSFLPVKTPAISNLDLAAICKPAYETGGDYYDFIQLDDHRVAVAIGDVSGKGIQAAFYMTFTKGILHSLCREIESPAELLKKANRLFYENAQRGTFISLVYGIVDVKEKTFRFARAGHNPVLHINGKTSDMKLLQPNGLGLGLTITPYFDNNIQETTLQLNAGDLLVLYTDGIIEALNSARQFYGGKRLRQLLKKEEGGKANQILTKLVEDVTKFAGQAKQHDDMTVMVIKLEEEEPIQV